jgi:hypothetical protein
MPCMGGWLIRILTPGEPPRVRLFAVAEDTVDLALESLLANARIASNEIVEAIGPLSLRTVQALGLERGGVLDATS